MRTSSSADSLTSILDAARGARAPVLVVVDPASTGAFIVAEAQRRGAVVVAVWSDQCGDEFRTHIPPMASGLAYAAELDEAGRAIGALADDVRAAVAAASGDDAARDDAGAAVRPSAVIAGSETGVRLQDALADALGVAGNGGASSATRRDKHEQQEAVRAAGLRAVKQALCGEWAECERFVVDELGAGAGGATDVVLKPTESAGSDGVARLGSVSAARAHFDALLGAINVCGQPNETVLAQEYLAGVEYCVDHVSRGGKHKTAIVWACDKRAANGATADIVYFGMRPLDPADPLYDPLVDYTRACLDAIGLREGASHAEVKVAPPRARDSELARMLRAPDCCLVEVNCRCHGNSGAWLPSARAATGATQVSLVLDAALDGGAAFDAAPDRPRALRRAAMQVFLCSYFEGDIAATPGYEAIRALPSFHAAELPLRPGDALARSVCCCTIAGQVQLVHDDARQVAEDEAVIRALERAPGALFELA